ncbi:hypothetical protein SDC9_168184 [bioreactor metagenome]|uniref:Uncharacterized protein n=1 Tax=bioreactor metagenome TaxID=1076179 RepID=A0A645G2E8_9ZZZZ
MLYNIAGVNIDLKSIVKRSTAKIREPMRQVFCAETAISSSKSGISALGLSVQNM